MSLENKYLDMRDAAIYIGQTVRWMRRHYPAMSQEGVEVLRVPKGSPKGHLHFTKASLDRYMASCRLMKHPQRPVGALPEGHSRARIATPFGGFNYTLDFDEYERCERSMCAKWVEKD